MLAPPASEQARIDERDARAEPCPTAQNNYVHDTQPPPWNSRRTRATEIGSRSDDRSGRARDNSRTLTNTTGTRSGHSPRSALLVRPACSAGILTRRGEPRRVPRPPLDALTHARILTAPWLPLSSHLVSEVSSTVSVLMAKPREPLPLNPDSPPCNAYDAACLPVTSRLTTAQPSTSRNLRVSASPGLYVGCH